MSQLDQRSPGRVGQATVVEQSRAVAEVLAAAELAVRFPRDEAAAEREMLRACSRRELAEVAEYAVPAGNKTAVGPSIVLAKELARIWGHVSHGVAELRRDAGPGQSELLVFAWDIGNVAAPVRSVRTVIVPHARDVGTGTRDLTANRDITNQNNSIAARQHREVIIGVLPHWFTTAAIARCRQTLIEHEQAEIAATRSSSGQTLDQKISAALIAWSGKGVTEAELIEYLDDRPPARWDVEDLVKLQTLWRSLMARQITIEDAFPGRRITAQELAPQPAAAPAARPAPAPIDDHFGPEPSDLDLEPTDAELAASAAAELAAAAAEAGDDRGDDD